MSRKPWIIAAAALVVALQAPVAAADPVDTARANELKARAEALFDQPARWIEAARLLEKSVEYRATTDGEIHNSLMTAAGIWLSSGEPRRAYSAARRAGENAHARGCVDDAANSFISAAGVAARLGAGKEAGELMERARMLAESPLLDAQARARILARDHQPLRVAGQ